MAEIDYAFLADYAKVEPNGTLTAIGASFTYVHARVLPGAHRMAVAGRIRAKVTEDPVHFEVTVTGPNGAFRLGAQGQLRATPESRPYGDGWIGHIFALDLQVPLPTEGLYVVEVSLTDGGSRELKFEVSSASPAQ